MSAEALHARGPKNPVAWTYRFAKAPIETHHALAKKYGDPFTIPLLAGSCFVTGKPDLVKQIYTAPPATFAPYTTIEPLVGSSSLFVTGADRHLTDRRLFTPLFHGSSLPPYVPAIRSSLALETSRWSEGGELDLLELTQRLSFAVMARVGFGMESELEAAELERALSGVLATGSPLLLFFPFLQREFGGRGPWSKFLRARAAFDDVLLRTIQKRRERKNESVVSRMLELTRTTGEALTDVEVRDQLVTFLLGGYESTALAMAWLLYSIARDEDVQAKLRDEVQTLDHDATWKHVDALPYLNAVFLESLRRFPAVPQTSRKVVRPLCLGDYNFDKGDTVAASLVLAQWNPDTFPDPMRFSPDRWSQKKIDTSAWIPFGGGARRCIGASLAECEAKVIVASVLRTHRFRARSGPVPDMTRRTLVLGPKTPLRAAAMRL